MTEIRASRQLAGRAGQAVHVFGDLVVFLDDSETAAVARKQRLDERAGAEYTQRRATSSPAPRPSWPTCCWTGRPAGLSGFRLRPGALPHDLTQITELPGARVAAPRRVPHRLPRRPATLRGLLGLARPANRYAAA